MEDEGQGPQIPGPSVEAQAPAVEAAIDQQIGQIEQVTEGINPAQNQQAAEHVEEDLAGQGPDAALEGLAQEGEQPGPAGESPTEQADGGTEQSAQGAQALGESANGSEVPGEEAQQDPNQQEPGQEQQAQPETIEQRVAMLQEQVARLTNQNEALAAELSEIKTQLSDVLIPALKAFLEKSEVEEQDPQKKLKFKDLLLILAALTVGAVGLGMQQVERASTGR